MKTREETEAPPPPPDLDPEEEKPGRFRRAGRAIKSLPWRFIVPWTLFAIAATAAILFGLLWLQDSREEDELDEVRATAQRFALALTNFSADSIDEDVEKIKSFAAGTFAEEVDTFFGPEAVDAIKEADASSTGEVNGLFVQDHGDGRASVFAVVNETIQNTVLDDPQSDILRLEMGLTKADGEWKIDRVDIFQAPGSGLAPRP
jgi:hypothetical protein